jgi:hypothetical protein
MTFKVGDRVKWISSHTPKEGVVTHVVLPGQRPKHVGVFNAGGGGMSRDHDSYIVRGQKVDHRGEVQRRAANYWPIVSLLEADAS